MIQERPVIKKCVNLPQGLPGARSLVFSPDSKRLIVGGSDCVVYVLGLENVNQVTLLTTFTHHTGHFNLTNKMISGTTKQDKIPSAIISLVVSFDGQWLVTGDLLNRIYVFDLDTLMVYIIENLF